MTKETAKAIIDLLFKMYDEDKPDAFINHTTVKPPALVYVIHLVQERVALVR